MGTDERNSDAERSDSVHPLEEEEMFGPMKRYLRKLGYEIVETNTGRQQGPDIRASREGQELIVEMKGNTKALKTDLHTGIGQICGRVGEEADEYGLALSGSYRNYIDDYLPGLRKLGVSVFIVSKDGVEPWQSRN